MAFDFNKIASASASEKPSAPASTVDPLNPLTAAPQSAPKPVIEQPATPTPRAANPLDALLAGSEPSANVGADSPAGNPTLDPLFGQANANELEAFPALPIAEGITDPEAIDFLSNIATLQQAIGNPQMIGDSIRYIGEELRTKKHLSPVLAQHPSHMGLIVTALRKTYNVALGASVKRKTTRSKKKQEAEETNTALDNIMGGLGGELDLSGFGDL